MIHIYNPFKFVLTSFILSLLIIPFHSNSFKVSAQIVNVELTSGVYDFLERMNLKEVIILDDEAKPYSRKYIAEKIIEIKNKIKLDNSDFSEVKFDKLNFWA